MKLFCAFAFTGQPIDEITERMQLVVDTLNKNGHNAYCNLFDDYLKTLVGRKAILKYAFETIPKYDGILVVMASDQRSEGQLIEVGAAISRDMPIYLLQHKTAVDKTYLPELAEKTFVWETTDELTSALQNI